jgi:hypothetical protein
MTFFSDRSNFAETADNLKFEAAKPRRARPAPQGGRVPHPPSGRAHRFVLCGKDRT